MGLDAIARMILAQASKAEHQLLASTHANLLTRDKALAAKMNRLAMKGADDQAAVMRSPEFLAVDRQRLPLSIAKTNLRTAQYAANPMSADEEARLLLALTPDQRAHAASLFHYVPDYYKGDRGIPPGAVYIEGLSSEVPGGGTALLKKLESQYPGAPMVLQSLPIRETEQFYAKKGFVPMPDKSSDALSTNYWLKPAGVQVKKDGGAVRMQQGGRPKPSAPRNDGPRPIPQRPPFTDFSSDKVMDDLLRLMFTTETSPVAAQSSTLQMNATHPRHFKAQGGLVKMKECSCG